ncbi:MAG: hypothetical protein ACPGSB_02355, partial [Opitutales bacterium]
SIWRGKNFTRESGDIDLLYGKEKMPVRLDARQFRRGGDYRGDFAILKWGLFLINNLAQIGEIEDGEEVVLVSIPLLFGKTWDITTTFEDGGDWDIVDTGWDALYGEEGVAFSTLNGLTLQFGLGFSPEVGYLDDPDTEEVEADYPISGNFYTWSMQALNGKLYFGTLDIIGDGLGPILPGSADGADIFCFPDHNSPAELISSDAFGSPYAYGIRNLQADEERGELYAGTANPSNLRHRDSAEKLANQPDNNDADVENDDDTLDEGDGGWELLRVTFEGGGVEEAAAEIVEKAVLSSEEPEALSASVAATDKWLLKTQDSTSATISFTSVGADASGMKALQWASYPGKFYTVYIATEAEGEWLPVQTYNGTGGTLTYEWDATSSDIRYVKVVESSEAPIASL